MYRGTWTCSWQRRSIAESSQRAGGAASTSNSGSRVRGLAGGLDSSPLPLPGPRWGPGFEPPSSARASLGAWIRAPFLCQGLPRTSLIAPRLNREEHRGYKTGPLPGAQGKAGPGRHQEDRQAAPVSPSPSGLAGLAPARHYLPDLFLFFRRTSLGCFSQHVAEDATPSTSNVTRMFLKCLSWSSPHPFQSHRKISEQLRLSERIKRVQTEDMVMP